jgi:hypothetical protein
MTKTKFILLGVAAVALSACVSSGPNGNISGDGWVEWNNEDNTSDRHLGRDNHLSNMRDAGIWVDPQGCDHWIIDEGVEGYMSARLDQYGNPVCSGIAPPTVAVGRYRRGT